MQVKLNHKILKGAGLRCDHDGCDYSETYNLSQFVYLNEFLDFQKSQVGKVCPKCGAVLVTEQDMRVQILCLKVIHCPVVRFISWIGSLFHARTCYGKFSTNGGNLQYSKSSQGEIDENNRSVT